MKVLKGEKSERIPINSKSKSKSFTFDCGDKVERYNHPYHEFSDGSTVPYGHVCDDGIYRICYSTTSRYGYGATPIYAVRHDFNDGGYPDHMYHIFIGECPHKDENCNWATYNEVPNFMMGAFGGSRFIDDEPDIPHIIRLETDEFFNKNREERNYNLKKIESDATKLQYCTFKDYLNGLKNRINLYLHINSGVGEQYKYKSIFIKKWHLQLLKAFDNTETYVDFEDSKYVRRVYFKKDSKCCLKYEKWIDTGDRCSC